MLEILTVTDIYEEEIAIYHKLRENAFHQDNSFIADSPKVVNLLLKSNIEVKSILATQEYYDEFSALIESKNISKIYLTTKQEMHKIVGHKIHHNCMMHGVRPPNINIEKIGNTAIMLDNITSSENVGSIVRSAAALGVKGFLLPPSSPHPFNRRSLRVSMGHSYLLNTYVYNNLVETLALLKLHGYTIVAAETTSNAIPLSQLVTPKKWILLMGHEGEGISESILSLCDEIVSIEMQEGIKSFNVAVAASIIMYKLII